VEIRINSKGNAYGNRQITRECFSADNRNAFWKTRKKGLELTTSSITETVCFESRRLNTKISGQYTSAFAAIQTAHATGVMLE
jgi:hypothetical protein